MLQCDERICDLQSASAELAEAFGYFLIALDACVVEVPAGAKRPPWGKAPPGLPFVPVRGMTRMDPDDQRTVKASVCY